MLKFRKKKSLKIHKYGIIGYWCEWKDGKIVCEGNIHDKRE